MRAHVFKSLSCPVYWGGLPRNVFICILMLSILMVFVFRSLKALIPLFFVYSFLLFLVKNDHRIFGILKESLKFKSHYY